MELGYIGRKVDRMRHWLVSGCCSYGHECSRDGSMRNNCAIRSQNFGDGAWNQLAAVDDVGFARVAVLGRPRQR